jgi:hypothetical protein
MIPKEGKSRHLLGLSLGNQPIEVNMQELKKQYLKKHGCYFCNYCTSLMRSQCDPLSIITAKDAKILVKCRDTKSLTKFSYYRGRGDFNAR